MVSARKLNKNNMERPVRAVKAKREGGFVLRLFRRRGKVPVTTSQR